MRCSGLLEGLPASSASTPSDERPILFPRPGLQPRPGSGAGCARSRAEIARQGLGARATPAGRRQPAGLEGCGDPRWDPEQGSAWNPRALTCVSVGVVQMSAAPRGPLSEKEKKAAVAKKYSMSMRSDPARPRGEAWTPKRTGLSSRPLRTSLTRGALYLSHTRTSSLIGRPMLGAHSGFRYPTQET